MKNCFVFFLANILLLNANAQSYWQQRVDYTIDVSLNDKEKTLDGFERLVYTNNSPDTLRFIWFHLWPNAYKNDKTAFSEQTLQNGDTRFYFSDKEQRGYINRLDFKVDGTTAQTEDHPQHIDIVKLILPRPLLPKQKITITTPFHVKLPFNFSRGGYDGQSFQLTQWYPKPAVYDRNGWHPMPYLDKGEFYSEFGSFVVRFTLPKAYAVAATGVLQNEEEKAWLKGRENFQLPPVAKQTRPQPYRSAKVKPTPVTPSVPEPGETKTLQYQQDSIHDFALFASKDFIVNCDTLQLPSGRIVNVAAFYTPTQKSTWSEAVRYAKEALRFYSAALGEYPYPVATVVQGPESFGGGMEYPTITVLAPTGTAQELDGLVAHELGHNWFYGILASNERQHPWLDEGLNSYYEGRYLQSRWGPQSRAAEVLFQHKAANKTDQAIATPSDSLSSINYFLSAYHKTAEWFKMLEQMLGTETFDAMMRRYYAEWKFRHPQPEDFKAFVADALGAGADEMLAALNTKGVLPGNQFTGTTVVHPFKKGAVNKYLEAPTKNLLLLSPALGYNVYDQLQIGGLVTNYGSPGVKLNFLAVPLYATGSQSLTGLGKLNLALRSNGFIRKTDIFFNAASFHMDQFSATNDETLRLRFTKLVPGVRFTLKEKSPLSTERRYIQWKTFLIGEQNLRITTDSIFSPTDTIIQYNFGKQQANRYLNQLQLVYRNDRALYPFDATLQVEQAQDFIRTTFTGNTFFNYAKGGGLSVRFFAGKFSYLQGKTVSKQFATDRYHLNMTGAKGYEDYTYSDYFIGRNRFDGLSLQQVMIRDGGFKVRTDLLAQKIGKTDNWLAAVNFVSTVPDKFNPLSLLPVKFPLRVFADIGASADAWERTENADRFLFDAGLQLSLLDEALNIYIPIFYSKVYRDYFKSTLTDNRFLKTISFSINLYNNSLRKLNRELEF
ncbi:M1 family metallopeptidase [Flavisolibacter sp. BT320]|nr:M1 family metallopeptidase [Flavisolibacter longurius]